MEKEKNNVLQSVRILVAEDNRINQIVILTLLESQGLIPKIVSNGKEAADAVKKSDFDLILMDIQMPEMDGYEAAAAIREFEKLRMNPAVSGIQSRIPIIAMTAHMMDGEKQRCLDAGMDDYLSKPVDPDEIFAVLKNHVRAENSRGEKREILFSPASASQNPASDLSPVDTAFGIRRLSGNAELYTKLMLSFAADYADAADRIRKNLEKGNTEQTWQMVHSIKGVAGNMGASELWKSSDALESCIRKHPGRTMGEVAEYAQILRKFASALHAVKQAAEQMKTAEKNEPEKNDRSRDNSSELKNLLTELSRFLKNGDTEAAESLKKLKPLFSSSGMEEMLNSLEDQIFDFDFEKARETLNNIVSALNKGL